jgi:hypothetical protein
MNRLYLPLKVNKDLLYESLEKGVRVVKNPSIEGILKLRDLGREIHSEVIDGVFFKSEKKYITLDGREGTLDFVVPMGILPGEEMEIQNLLEVFADDNNLPRKTPINPENSWLMIRYGICPESFEYQGKSKGGIPIFMGPLDLNVSDRLGICDGQIDLFNKYVPCLKREGFQVFEAEDTH